MNGAPALHRSRAFDALGWTFSVASDRPEIVAYVESIFDGFASGTEALVHEYVMVSVDRDDERPVAELALDDERVSRHSDEATLVMTLVHDVNRRVLATSPLLAAHAAGVVRDGAAVVLPAHMESGKTTLTAGLVRAGFGYLTDEAVAFDWDTLEIVPYPKPLSIDHGSWELFPELEPHAPLASDGYKSEQWQVSANAIRPGAVGGGGRACHLVFPKYEEHAPTELVPIGRAEALVELARNTFRFRTHGRRALTTLARIVEGADCYRMSVGSLDDAVALIGNLVRAGTG